MTRLTDQEIEEIARRIVADIKGSDAPLPSAPQPSAPSDPEAGKYLGIYPTVAQAVAAAETAFPKFVALELAHRARIIEAMRQAMRENNEMLSREAHNETGLGRFEDKVVKNSLVTEKTPGVEDLAPTAVTGDHGLMLMEPAPFGVIGAITPTTRR